MKSTHFLSYLFFILAWMYWMPAQAQNVDQQDLQTAETAIPRDSIEAEVFDAVEIAEAMTESNTLISDAGKMYLLEDARNSITRDVDTLTGTIDDFIGDSAISMLEGIDFRELDAIGLRVEHYQDQINRAQQNMINEVKEREELTESLADQHQKWALTLETLEGAEIPEGRLERISRTRQKLDSVSALIQDDIHWLLAQEDRLTDSQNDLRGLTDKIEEQKTLLSERLFSRDRPSLLDEYSMAGEEKLFKKHLLQAGKSFKDDLEIVKAEYRTPLLVFALLFLIFASFTLWYKQNYEKTLRGKKFAFSEVHLALIHLPVATSLFTVGVMIRFILPDLPHTFNSLNFLVMVIPMYRIVARIFGERVRTWFLLLVILYALTLLYEMTYDPDILLRVILLFFSLSGFVLLAWLYIKRPESFQFKSIVVQRLLRLLLFCLTILLLIAIFANLMGAFSLAEFFTLLPIQIILLAVGVQIATKVADTVVYLILASSYMQKFNIVKDDFDYLYRKFFWLADIILWIMFFSMVLGAFRVRDSVVEWFTDLLTNGIQIGAVELTLGSILLFIVVIWLSIAITRMLSHILERDVFPRVKTKKGTPTTVIIVLRISMITAGFMLAAAAAGVKLSNLSIIIGAFSVGIGFGLQNIFNNMVSGLILAFERPIKVGDVVQVGTLMGRVKTIGLRASTVKSFDGSEVIVPNGNLISNEMINWTLSDSNRRMDIRVGVAYGSDVDKVIEIMEKVADEHELVNKKYAAIAYFIGFGDSSLDFKLHAWTHIDKRLNVESDLHRAINRALKRAKIEIPFPQRDIHIRSDETKSK